MLPDHITFIIINTDQTNNAGLAMLPSFAGEGLSIDIKAGGAVLLQGAFSKKAHKIIPALLINPVTVRVNIGVKINLGFTDVQKAGGIVPCQFPGLITADYIIGWRRHPGCQLRRWSHTRKGKDNRHRLEAP